MKGLKDYLDEDAPSVVRGYDAFNHHVCTISQPNSDQFLMLYIPEGYNPEDRPQVAGTFARSEDAGQFIAAHLPLVPIERWEPVAWDPEKEHMPGW